MNRLCYIRPVPPATMSLALASARSVHVCQRDLIPAQIRGGSFRMEAIVIPNENSVGLAAARYQAAAHTLHQSSL